MARKLRLYACPALSARITKSQCKANQSAAGNGERSPAGKRRKGEYAIRPNSGSSTNRAVYLEACKTCPGVVAVARRKGTPAPYDYPIGPDRQRTSEWGDETRRIMQDD